MWGCYGGPSSPRYDVPYVDDTPTPDAFEGYTIEAVIDGRCCPDDTVVPVDEYGLFDGLNLEDVITGETPIPDSNPTDPGEPDPGEPDASPEPPSEPNPEPTPEPIPDTGPDEPLPTDQGPQDPGPTDPATPDTGQTDPSEPDPGLPDPGSPDKPDNVEPSNCSFLPQAGSAIELTGFLTYDDKTVNNPIDPQSFLAALAAKPPAQTTYYVSIKYFTEAPSAVSTGFILCFDKDDSTGTIELAPLECPESVVFDQNSLLLLLNNWDMADKYDVPDGDLNVVKMTVDPIQAGAEYCVPKSTGSGKVCYRFNIFSCSN